MGWCSTAEGALRPQRPCARARKRARRQGERRGRGRGIRNATIECRWKDLDGCQLTRRRSPLAFNRSLDAEFEVAVTCRQKAFKALLVGQKQANTFPWKLS